MNDNASPLFGAALRQPPANVEAEMALLGALLHNNKALALCGALAPEHFAGEGLGPVFAAFQEGVEAGRPVDAVSLKGRFDNNLLASLLASMVGITTASEYARVIIERAQQRSLIEIADRLRDGAFGSIPPAELAAEALAQIEVVRIGAAVASDLTAARLGTAPVDQIPPRPWAYGRFLLFGSAAVLGAVDGGGKGAITVAILLAIITGKPLLGEQVWRVGPVAIISYEDDEAEWRRRIAAACIHYDLDYGTVLASVRFISRAGGRVTFATHSEAGVVFPDSAAIIARLKEIDAALLIVDPFNHAHRLDDGNSNALVARVAGELTRIAQETDCAVLVLHHLRKGANGNPDDLMGATSLRATFRSCRILARMAPEVAEKMTIADPWRYIRVAGSKENYAPPPERGTWYRLVGVPLGNATEQYPDGDNVAVATPWAPPGMFDGMDAPTLAAVFAALRQGQWAAAKQSKTIPWAGNALIDIGGRSDRDATRIIAAWIDSGMLVKGEHSTASRNKVVIVTLDDAKAAEIVAEYRTIDGRDE